MSFHGGAPAVPNLHGQISQRLSLLRAYVERKGAGRNYVASMRAYVDEPFLPWTVYGNPSLAVSKTAARSRMSSPSDAAVCGDRDEGEGEGGVGGMHGASDDDGDSDAASTRPLLSARRGDPGSVGSSYGSFQHDLEAGLQKHSPGSTVPMRGRQSASRWKKLQRGWRRRGSSARAPLQKLPVQRRSCTVAEGCVLVFALLFVAVSVVLFVQTQLQWYRDNGCYFSCEGGLWRSYGLSWEARGV